MVKGKGGDESVEGVVYMMTWAKNWLLLSNTMWPGTRPTSLPSGILIHPAIWPQQTWAENWGLRPLFGDGSWVPTPHLT